MKRLQTLILLVPIAVTLITCTKPQSQDLLTQRLKPCNRDGLDSTVLCGTLSVFENPTTRSGRKIDLNIIVIPAIHKSANNSPIFYLEGGPGVAATPSAPFFADSINYYRLTHDIVLVDARGTGKSNPLQCRQLQYKKDLAEQFDVMYPATKVKDCYDSLSKLADLTQYTTTNIATDLEEVRKWLGYGKIDLYGLSYGTRLAQVYMKMFPDAVRSCVLWSPTTTYSKMPLYHAQYAEESLNKLFEGCIADSMCNKNFPNLHEEFNSLKTRGEQKPFSFKLKTQDGKSTEITIPWHAFHTKIRSYMYAPDRLRQVPFLIHEASIGNWQPFISLFPKSANDNFIAEGLYLCITCTEDVPFITKAAADSLTKDTFMGDYRIVQQQTACANWAKGEVPDGFLEPLTSTIPTLIFSGNYDPVTPPSMAEEIIKTLSNGYLISIPEMSHTFDGLTNPECFDKICFDFFNDPSRKPDSECTKQMLPPAYRVL